MLLMAGLVGTAVGFALAIAAWLRNLRIARHPGQRFSCGSLSVIIPAHNEEAVIAATVSGVADAVPPGTQIIIVDDGSTDHTADLLGSLAVRIDGLCVVRHEVARGKPAALNTALTRAHGDIVLFLDADTRIDAGAICWYVSYLEGRNVAAVCADMAPYNRVRTPAVVVQEIYYAVCRAFLLSGLHGYPATNGYGLFVRRDALQRAGPFSVNSLVDDLDLGIRLTRAGERVLFVRGPRCYIQYAPSFGSFLRQHHRWISGGLQEVLGEIRRGSLHYAAVTAIVASLLYSSPLLVLLGLATDSWTWPAQAAMGIWAAFSSAVAVTYLLERPPLLHAALNLPLCLVFLPLLQAALAAACVSTAAGARRWHKVPREAD